MALIIRWIIMPERILVTGKNGQLGQSLQKIAAEFPQFDFVFAGREELDLSSSASIESFFSAASPFAAIINAAAYTAVDKAESESELADQVNHLAVAQLAEIAKKQNIILLHVSTDYVFDGKSYRPYVETDGTSPQNQYGFSKLKGEQAMFASGCTGAIVRTSWVYSEFGNNFVKTMLRIGRDRDSLNVIFDQVGSPTYATDLARTLVALLECCVKENVEIYHYSNEGVCSWYDFATAIFELSDVPCTVSPIETKDYPTPASRPHYSLLNKTKIKLDANLVVPHWRDSLQLCLRELK